MATQGTDRRVEQQRRGMLVALPSGLRACAILLLIAMAIATAAEEKIETSASAPSYEGLSPAAAQVLQALPFQRDKPAPVLAYVTPWNGAGYDLAKQRRCRLHYVAPVWYQLRVKEGRPALTGGHDVDAAWLAAVRQPCGEEADAGSPAHSARVLPRVIFEVSGQELMAVLSQPDEVAALLAGEAQKHGFDGWVVEAWSSWAAMGLTQHPQGRQAALTLLRRLSSALSSAGRKLVLAVSPLVPAPGRPAQLTVEDVEELLGLADGLSVMTYDHASPQKPGPNAPLPWVVQNADAFAAVADRLPGKPRSKVLQGIPFYGFEYRFRSKQLAGLDAVTSGRLLEVLRTLGGAGTAGTSGSTAAAAAGEGGEGQAAEASSGGGSGQQSCSWEEVQRDIAAGTGACASAATASGGSKGSGDGLQITWLDESREHLLRWKEAVAGEKTSSSKQKKEQHLLYFPTPRAVQERLTAAAERSMGASVWELGQGTEEMAALL